MRSAEYFCSALLPLPFILVKLYFLGNNVSGFSKVTMAERTLNVYGFTFRDVAANDNMHEDITQHTLLNFFKRKAKHIRILESDDEDS